MKPSFKERADKRGLYENIAAKRRRIKAQKARGAKKVERMRKPGSEGAPSPEDFKKSAKTAKGAKREDPGGNLRSYMDTPKMKRGMKREDPKGNPAGYYDSSKKKKKKVDKSPYADGMGKKCTCDSVAEELRGLLITGA